MGDSSNEAAWHTFVVVETRKKYSSLKQTENEMMKNIHEIGMG